MQKKSYKCLCVSYFYNKR